MGKIIIRERTGKPKTVFPVRLSEEDLQFLQTVRNASEFFHQAIEEEKKKQRMAGGAFNYELVKEMAEAIVKDKVSAMLGIKEGQRRTEEDEEGWKHGMQNVLYNIASLTLKLRSPLSHNKGELEIPSLGEMEYLLEQLQSKESKDFIGKIKANIEQARQEVIGGIHVTPERIVPLTEAEMNLVRKLYDEAKYQLEKEYRKNFHKLPPEGWDLYVTDWASGQDYGKELRYKLP